jgi:hypothetical protein
MVVSVTTSNEAWGRNPHAPFGFAAARGRLRRCPSTPMPRRIGYVAAPCIRPRGAANAAYAITRTGS